MKQYKIAVVGLGYVGLPLALEFAKRYAVVGYDIDSKRIKQLIRGDDKTREVSSESLKRLLTETKENTGLYLTNEVSDIENCNIYIVTVPTPVSENKNPDISLLIKASRTVGEVLKKEDIVIYESTVYPGATEEDCVPVLEEVSGLRLNIDFYCGYSPERINPGDKKHTISKIKKITSGSTPSVAKEVNDLYATIISAGTYLAPSIKVAEAAKIIENAQRDINIAFVNELAKIFNKLNIDTQDVLMAANTKWNFLPFKPGLVGGHCIGVDPYYLAQKAQEIGYYPEIILAGRKLNDSMGEYIGTEVLKLAIDNNINIKNAKVLILGITFKENCPDIRNTKVIDLFKSLTSFLVDVSIYDPLVDIEEVRNTYAIEMISSLTSKYDIIVHAVAHREFENINLNELKKEGAVVYDIKGNLDISKVDKRL